MSGYVSVSMQRLAEAHVSRRHLSTIRANGAVPRPHMAVFDHVPVGLVRKALRYRRACQRALRLSGGTPEGVRRKRYQIEQWRYACERYGLTRTTTVTGDWKTTTFTSRPTA